jgi:acyl-CoA synthetase (NDP forming)/RimJ/RimL family protein N-acetyltransferase
MLRRDMLTRPLAATRFDPERLFRPRSLAIIGGEGRIAAQVRQNIEAAGFAGDVQVVAPGDPLRPADLAVLTVPEGDLAPVYRSLAAAGIFAGVALGMAHGLAEAQAETGVRVLGPGSFGVACPAIKLNATLAHLEPRAGRVALISQSAALCRAVLDWAGPNGVGFSEIVGVGGNAGTGFVGVLDYLSRDSSTGPILLDIRRIRDARAFLSAARAAARLRPVVALRAGNRLLDPTGRAERVFEAALNRAGVLTVSRFEDMLAALETLTRSPVPRTEGLAIVTNAIGPGRMAADAALGCGVGLAPLAPETREVLRLAIPGTDQGRVVYTGVEQPTRLADAASLLAGAKEVGGILAVLAPTGPADAAGVEALLAVPRGRVPLLVCAMGETTGAAHRHRLAEAGIPVFATPEQAVGGFLHLLRQRRARAAGAELPASEVLELRPDRARLRRIVALARSEKRVALTVPEVRSVLAGYGLRRPPVRVAVEPDALFGPAIEVGGGELGQRGFDLPPLNLSLAHGLVAHSPAASALLPAQAEALADVLVRVSQLLVDLPELHSLLLDPASDPAIGLRPQGELGRLVIPPYPAELVERWTAKGETFTIRPIRPEDAAAHRAFFTRISPEDVRLRFFSALRELSAERIARMTQVDYDREMAFVAVRANGDTVGVSRVVRERDEGEFAVIVQADVKGLGLARHLMERLIAWSRDQGVTAVVGQVLAENAPMLAFVRKLGFKVQHLPDEPEVVEARLDLVNVAET